MDELQQVSDIKSGNHEESCDEEIVKFSPNYSPNLEVKFSLNTRSPSQRSILIEDEESNLIYKATSDAINIGSISNVTKEKSNENSRSSLSLDDDIEINSITSER